MLAFCGIISDPVLVAQDGPATQPARVSKALSYEVVSIKLHHSSDSFGGMRTLSDGFEWANIPMAVLVRGVYGIVIDSQIAGLPGWATSDRYDIEAKVDAGTAESWKKLTPAERWAQEQPMMLQILTDRCNFKAHLQKRELPVYHLVIAKGGLKMKEAQAGEGSMEDMSHGGKMVARAMAVDSVASSFTGIVGRMIVDKTELGEKKFDFDLSWTPVEQVSGNTDIEGGPSIFTALEEQLGLKLVPDKEQVQVLVIDHMERPSAN